MEQTNLNKIKEYNEEPVYFCRHCLSLRIMNLPNSDECYCDKCNSTDIDKDNIYVWDNLYTLRYGKSFLKTK